MGRYLDVRMGVTYSSKVDGSISVMYIHEEEDDSALSSVNKRSRNEIWTAYL